MTKNVYWPLYKVPLVHARLKKIIDRLSKHKRNIKIHKNPPSGSRFVPCGRTDGHDEANSRFSQFYESA